MAADEARPLPQVLVVELGVESSLSDGNLGTSGRQRRARSGQQLASVTQPASLLCRGERGAVAQKTLCDGERERERRAGGRGAVGLVAKNVTPKGLLKDSVEEEVNEWKKGCGTAECNSRPG